VKKIGFSIITLLHLIFGQLCHADEYNHKAYDDNRVIINYTGSVIFRPCSVETRGQGDGLNWPNIIAGDLKHNTAETKTYAISIICGQEGEGPSVVNVSFVGSQPFLMDGERHNRMPSGLAGMGFEVNWQDTTLPLLELDKVNISTLAGVGNYSLSFKPVSIANVIIAGTFDATLTMNIEHN
jgi:type 1 fimbria pilin